MGPIIRANRWFDDQSEPWRFLIFMLAICLPVGLLSAYQPIAYFVTVIVLGAQRLWWLKIGSRR